MRGIGSLGGDHQRGGARLVHGAHVGAQFQQRRGGRERAGLGGVDERAAAELIAHGDARRTEPPQFRRIVLARAVDHPGGEQRRIRGADGLPVEQRPPDFNASAART